MSIEIRPQNRRRLVGLIAIVALLLTVGGLALARQIQSQDAVAERDAAWQALGQQVPSLELAFYQRLYTVANSQNAARWVQAGASLIDRDDELNQALSLLGTRSATELEAEMLEHLSAHLDGQREALDLIVAAAPLTESSFDLYYERGADMPIPNLTPLLNAARLLLADTQLSIAEGRLDDASRAVDGLRVLAFVMVSEYTTPIQVLSYSIEDYYAHGLGELVAAGFNEIDYLERHRESFGPEAAQRFRSMIGTEAGVLRYSLPRIGRAGVAEMGVDRSLASLGRDGYVYFSGVLKAAEGTLAEIHAGRFDAELEHPLRRGWLPVPALMPNYRTILSRAKAAEARTQLARLALRLRLESLRTGAYPDGLSGFEEAASNPLTGARIAYRPLAGGGVELEIEGGAQLFSESLTPAMREVLPAAPFVWRLPPLS